MTKYKPLGTWTEFGDLDAITQSLHVLDVAADLAVKQGDTKALMKLSHQWLDILARIDEITENIEESTSAPSSKKSSGEFGFAQAELERVDPDAG